MTTPATEKTKINWNELAMDSVSAIGLYWGFDNYLRLYVPTIYSELLGVGLVGGASITFMSDFLYQLFMESDEEKTKREAEYKALSKEQKDKLSSEAIQDFAIGGVSTAAIYYMLRTVMPQSYYSMALRYAIVIASVISSKFIKDKIKEWMKKDEETA